MSTALQSKTVATATSKANYELMYSSRDPRSSTADVRKRYHKAMRRAVRRFIIESTPRTTNHGNPQRRVRHQGLGKLIRMVAQAHDPRVATQPIS